MDKTRKIAAVIVAAGCVAGAVKAEFGIGSGGSFSYKALFDASFVAQPPAADPGSATGGIDHFYEDGYNRVDSSGNFGGKTTYWGYQDAAQYNPAGDGGNGTITMSSSFVMVDSGAASVAETEGAQPMVELYWRTDLDAGERWNIGFRAALRWQRIELENSAVYDTTVTTIADAYSLAGVIPPIAPFSGSYTGPNALLGDAPARTTSFQPGSATAVYQAINADLLAVDLGPSYAVKLTDRLSAAVFMSLTLAHIQSDFSYRSTVLGRGGDQQEDWVFGANMGTDLQCRIGERWGLFCGAAYGTLMDFSQEASNGYSAVLQFDDSFTLRAGLFFR